MREPSPQVIHLKDYTPPAFLIPETELFIEIFSDHARVRAKLKVERNPASQNPHAPLELDGDELQLESVSVDGRMLAAGEFEHDDRRLAIAGLPERFTLETSVRITPQTNTHFMGLYASRAGYFTQCEAQGFRRITWFMDRPDVMSRYTVTITADKEACPILLSNGNLDASGDSDNGRHWARWVDPFRKPCYLCAMVAGKLDVLEDRFTTRSGREVKLAIYVDPGKLDQCGFAMQALKRAMKWDEDVFGLELDLDQYMIVAVGDFNMGAMENKGLNIFNTKYVLARPDTATDIDFMQLDRVVAHEYFHNWTGNRVTCRDWFQLSLKEGLTVFRDQEYGADTYSRPVQRIQEVRGLRGAQFPEDAGPMAHPVRPQSYMEISNFYTATVYEKGAEVVRMIHTLIGAENFRKGMDLYFQRHDGQAVTCDDFVAAMADASGVDLMQFKRWYDQAGTPRLDISDDYDAASRRYTLTVRQSCPPTPESAEKLAFHIPLALGLVSPEGSDYPLRLEGESQAVAGTRVIGITQPEQRLVFEDVPARPVPSLLREFSAPVILRYDYSEAALAHLIGHDSDSFNRWEAGQQLAAKLILRGAEALRDGGAMDIPDDFVHAFGRVLADATRAGGESNGARGDSNRTGGDPAFAAEALALPAEAWLAEQMDSVDPDSLHVARLTLRRRLARELKVALMLTWDICESKGPFSPDSASAAKRALKNLCMALLMELDDAGIRERALAQFKSADNMTDQMAALTAFANSEAPERTEVLEAFYQRWKDEPLVMDKWLSAQALSRLPGTLDEVKRLTTHPAFDIRNPNKVYALIRSFCANHVRFHAADGSGYAFAADRIIELDELNPQVAARVARAFDRWKRFDHHRRVHARAALERIRDKQGLSKDVAEIVGRALV